MFKNSNNVKKCEKMFKNFKDVVTFKKCLQIPIIFKNSKDSKNVQKFK